MTGQDIIGLLMVPAMCCGMNYTGSSCADIYSNNPETGNKSGYYHINESQWTCCNMTAIAANGDFITTCAGIGEGWRRIVNIDISAGDDCPGEWRKATHSNISFCRVASNSRESSSVSFSTNGISYQRVCGRARGYQKGDTIGFYMDLIIFIVKQSMESCFWFISLLW